MWMFLGSCFGLFVVLAALAAAYWIYRVRVENAQRIRAVQEGVPVLAVVVQISDDAYDPAKAGLLDPCGEFLITFDRTIPDEKAFLLNLAKRMQALKGTQPTDPDVRVLADLINDERVHEGRRVQLPLKLTGGKVVYCTWLGVSMAGLPGGVLKEPFVKCMAIPGDKGILAQVDLSTPAPPPA